MRRWTVPTAFLLAAASLACDVAPPSDRAVDRVVAELSLVVGEVRLVEGDTTLAKAVPLGFDGDTIEVAVRWTSSRPDVARIDDAGEIVALDEGTTAIAARAGTRSAQDTLTVVQRVATIAIAGDEVGVTVGDTVQLAVTLRDPDGRTAEDRDPQWGTTNPAVASVNKRGSVRGQSPGTAGIWARIDGVADTIAVRVSPGEPAE